MDKAIQIDCKLIVKYGELVIAINMNMIDNECFTCHMSRVLVIMTRVRVRHVTEWGLV